MVRDLLGGVAAAAIVVCSWFLVHPLVETSYTAESNLLQPVWLTCCESAAQMSFPRWLGSSVLASALLVLLLWTVRPHVAALAGGGLVGIALVTSLDLSGDAVRQGPSLATMVHVWLLWLLAPIGVVAFVARRRTRGRPAERSGRGR